MNKVLDTTKFVVEHSDFVNINHEKLINYSQKLSQETFRHWLCVAPYSFDSLTLTDEEKLRLLFVFNTISFSYWGEPKWAIEYDNRKYDGSWGMISALYRAIKEEIPILDFKYLARMKKPIFGHIMRSNAVIPLFDERLKFINDIGFQTQRMYDGSMHNLIASSDFDALKLLDVLTQNFPSFHDSAFYKGKEIFFFKRAQLFIADVRQMFNGRDYGNLKNIDYVTACADYKLPQILRKFGILEYQPSLEQKVDQKVEIAKHSPEEIEIRANTIWAVEWIKTEIKKTHPSVTSFNINDHLWLETQIKLPDDKPYHRTRTTAY